VKHEECSVKNKMRQRRLALGKWVGNFLGSKNQSTKTLFKARGFKIFFTALLLTSLLFSYQNCVGVNVAKIFFGTIQKAAAYDGGDDYSNMCANCAPGDSCIKDMVEHTYECAITPPDGGGGDGGDGDGGDGGDGSSNPSPTPTPPLSLEDLVKKLKQKCPQDQPAPTLQQRQEMIERAASDALSAIRAKPWCRWLVSALGMAELQKIDQGAAGFETYSHLDAKTVLIRTYATRKFFDVATLSVFADRFNAVASTLPILDEITFFDPFFGLKTPLVPCETDRCTYEELESALNEGTYECVSGLAVDYQRAEALLHEVGHITKPGDDRHANQSASDKYNKLILQQCITGPSW
jgi:hypothetical protein